MINKGNPGFPAPPRRTGNLRTAASTVLQRTTVYSGGGLASIGIGYSWVPCQGTQGILPNFTSAPTGLLVARNAHVFEEVCYWLHCMPVSQGQYSLHSLQLNPPHSWGLHPILLNLYQSYLWLTPVQWFWFSYGHGRPWPYKGGDFLPLYQGDWQCWSGPTLFQTSFLLIWPTLQGHLRLKTPVYLCLHSRTCLAPPIWCFPFHCRSYLLRRLRNQISSSAHSGVVRGHVEFLVLGSSTSLRQEVVLDLSHTRSSKEKTRLLAG